MYTIDERLRGLPALKDQVVVLYQSLNQPNLAIPNRKAGPSVASVLGLRGPAGFAVFVYLYMPQSGESAVYVPSNGTVPAEQFQNEEAEALGFVESMGFIMDNLNFRGRPADEQDQMIRAMPVFQREAPAAQQPRASPAQGVRPASGQYPSVRELGKLFAAFTLAFLVSGCVSVDEKRKDARLHYDIAVEQLLKDPQAAYKETAVALELDPQSPEAWHLKALILHQVFHRLEEAQQAYSKALEFRTPYSDARVNLGNLYMDQKRYDDAISQYKIALTDVLYGAPYLAQGNMGWAYFKKGDNKEAIENLKGAVNTNPRYCLGEYQLGQIYESESNMAESCKYFARFREHCPDSADGWQRDGLCLANAGKRDEAAKAFDTCVAKAPNDDQKDLCKQLKAQYAQ